MHRNFAGNKNRLLKLKSSQDYQNSSILKLKLNRYIIPTQILGSNFFVYTCQTLLQLKLFLSTKAVIRSIAPINKWISLFNCNVNSLHKKQVLLYGIPK